MRIKSYFTFLGFKPWAFVCTEIYLISIGDPQRAQCRLLKITTHSSQAYISITKSSWSNRALQQEKCPGKDTMKTGAPGQGVWKTKQTQNYSLWSLWRLSHYKLRLFLQKLSPPKCFSFRFPRLVCEFQQTDEDFRGHKLSFSKYVILGFRDTAPSVHCLGGTTKTSLLSPEPVLKI